MFTYLLDISNLAQEPGWPSVRALGSKQKLGHRFDSASALLSLQKGCGLWTLPGDFVPHNNETLKWLSLLDILIQESFWS